MRWGLIGTGVHAEQKIAPALGMTAQERLHGAVGSTPEKAAAFTARIGGIAYPSFDAMLADKTVEAIFISTPNNQHREQTERAAAAGKHVLVEKPMALTAADCEAMIATCKRAGVALGVGFQQRHAPVHGELRRLIVSGALGDIVLVRGEWHTSYKAWANWRADPNQGGSDIVNAVGVHVFDLLSYLLASDVSDVASLVDIADDTRLDQTVAAAMRYQNGTIGTVTITRRARAATNSVFVLGTRGQATGIGTLGMTPTGRLETLIDGKAQEHSFPVMDLYAAQFEAFAAMVQKGEQPSASGRDGLASIMLAERLLAAAKGA